MTLARQIILKSDPDIDFEGAVEFRLAYEGLLLGASRKNTRAKHKHEIRKIFHRQLKQFWSQNRFLSTATDIFTTATGEQREMPLIDGLANNFTRCGYRMVPLITERYDLLCGLEIVFLRADPPGAVYKSGDIDNRIKTLLDALRMPKSVDELGGYTKPEDSENPFFVLLEDDKLIDRLSIETDTLLQPTAPDATVNDSRVLIKVKTKPYFVGIISVGFV